MFDKRNLKPKKKSIALPMFIWEALAEEARIERRTMTKQLEFILIQHFKIDVREISAEARPKGPGPSGAMGGATPGLT